MYVQTIKFGQHVEKTESGYKCRIKGPDLPDPFTQEVSEGKIQWDGEKFFIDTRLKDLQWAFDLFIKKLMIPLPDIKVGAHKIRGFKKLQKAGYEISAN